MLYVSNILKPVATRAPILVQLLCRGIYWINYYPVNHSIDCIVTDHVLVMSTRGTKPLMTIALNTGW